MISDKDILYIYIYIYVYLFYNCFQLLRSDYCEINGNLD